MKEEGEQQQQQHQEHIDLVDTHTSCLSSVSSSWRPVHGVQEGVKAHPHTPKGENGPSILPRP